MRGALGPPARTLSRTNESPTAVAAVVVVDDVVPGPEPLVGRHGDQKPAPGRNDAAQLAQGTDVVVKMLDDIEAEGKLEAVVRERHLKDGPFEHIPDVPGTRSLHAGRGELDAGHLAVALEIDHVAPGAAAGVEHAGLRRNGEVAQDDVEDTAARGVPPMAVLGAVGLELEVAIH